MTRRNSSSSSAPQPVEKITIAEAPKRCGWRRLNTFRERALSSDAVRGRFGLAYDSAGRAVVDAAKVAALVHELHAERTRRGNWRARNLGDHARPRRTWQGASSSRSPNRTTEPRE
jgi:hypothetical protein